MDSIIIRVKTWKKQKLSGWRFGVIASAVATIAVFIANVILLICAVLYSDLPKTGGIGTIFEGSCSTVKSLDQWSHLGINTLSTILLSASNYTQQCLSAPTRQEVDAAHVRQKWLDIGIPSWRNLRHIARRRIILWCFLGLSSIPLHFLYNSVIFADISAYEYVVNFTNPEGLTSYDEQPIDLSMFEKLENSACISAYGTQFVSDRADVFLISHNKRYMWEIPIFASPTRYTSYGWMCGNSTEPCDISAVASNASNWQIPDAIDNTSLARIEYCLSRPMPEHCRLQFSLHIIIVVIICNMVKAFCMLLTFSSQKAPTLVTLGDTISSFLQDPDPTTLGSCLLSKKNIKTAWVKKPQSQLWKPLRHYWFESVSLRRWIITKILCWLALIVASVLLSKGISSLPSSLFPPQSNKLESLWNLGFGDINVNSLIKFDVYSLSQGPLMAMILLANFPQVVLSFLYLAYNSLYTCMLLDAEWNNLGFKRKMLRVTSPKEFQQSTYWLSLPKKYSIPLIIMSGLLHWLVSQSIFLVSVTVYGATGNVIGDEKLVTCGYSCIAIIFVIIVGALMLFAVVGTGFRRFRPGIPLLGACSAVVSAACHRLQRDELAALQPLQWGVVSCESNSNSSFEHCCLSSQDVDMPVAGRYYAGIS